MLYLVIAIYLASLATYYDFGGRVATLRSVHRWLVLLVFVLLSGLRYRLAPDNVAYMSQFNTDVVPLGDLTFEHLADARYQPLWVLLNSFCKTLGSFTLLQIATALIFNGCVFHFFRKATTRFFTAVLLFYLTCFFYFNMEIVRESLAVGAFLVAICRYNDRKVGAFFAWLVVAVLFHKFAALLFITPLVLTRRVPTALKVLVAAIGGAWLASFDSPLAYLESFGGLVASLNLSVYDVDKELSSTGLVYHCLRIAPLIVALLWYRRRPLKDLRMRKDVIFPMAWVFVFVVLVRISSVPFVDRVSNYFVMFALLCLVCALADIVERRPLHAFRIPLVAGATVASLAFYLLPLLQPDPKLGDIPTYRRYYPYYSILSMETDPDREYIIEIEAKE